MSDKKQKMVHIFTLALGIALLPPIWAVLSAYIGVSVGSVALICAAVYVVNGNKIQDLGRMTLGFWMGDIWALAAMWGMESLSWNPDAELYLTLFLLGGAAVLIGEFLPKLFFTPAWLCGWAIGLTIMGPMQLSDLGTLPIQIGAAMLAGTVYVGVGVDSFQKWLIKRLSK